MSGILDKLLDLEKAPTARGYSATEYNLDRFAAFLESLGNPQRALRFIHVAGTKGKGSTVAFCEAILRAANTPTAMYSSPHLEHFGERFRFDGMPWTAAQFEDQLSRFFESLGPEQRRSFEGPHAYRTVFETLTALALTAFREYAATVQQNAPARPPLVVCWETGLGGRLDCTNVVDPIVSVITTIGLDHTALLGNTVEAITREKAGIIKPGRPVILCRQDPAHFDAVLSVVREVAAERGAPIIRAWEHNPVVCEPDDTVGIIMPDGEKFTARPGLRGGFQAGNMEGAIAACWYAMKSLGQRLDADAVAAGLGAVTWPGRLERHVAASGRVLLVDGAHCPLSARALGQAIDAELGKSGASVYTLILGMQRDKDQIGFVENLVKGCGGRAPARLLVYTIPGPRGGDSSEIAAKLAASGHPAEAFDTPAQAVARALDSPGLLVAGGTLYTIAAIRGAFRQCAV